MNILGIAHSHEAHACIVSDGKLINCIAEERLSRLKADSSFPKRAVDWVLSDAKMGAADLDLVCVAGQSGRLFKPSSNRMLVSLWTILSDNSTIIGSQN